MKLSDNGPAHFESAERLADAIIARVGRRIVLALPLGLGKANHVANALFARAAADASLSLRIFTALTLEKPHPSSALERRFIGPIAERCFGGYPDLAYAVALRKGLPPNVEVDEFFFQAGTRLGVAAAQQSYISANYTHALGCVLQRGVNVVGQLVAKRVRDGATRYSLSCNPDITLDLLAKRQSGAVDFVFIGQVNSELPFMPGEGDLAADAFDVILDSPQTDFPLFAPPREAIDLAEYAAGLRVAGIVADGGTLQLGIGALGDAVAQALILRHKNNAGFRDLHARGSMRRDRAARADRGAAVRGRSLRRQRNVRGRLSRAVSCRRPAPGGRGRAAAGGFFRGLARVLPRAARDAAGHAREVPHDGGVIRQRNLRR